MTVTLSDRRPNSTSGSTEASQFDAAFNSPTDSASSRDQEVTAIITNDREPEVRVDRIDGLPAQLVTAYVEAALRHAWVEMIDDAEFFASVSGLEGVWGEGESALEAERDLRESIFAWVSVHRARGLLIPRIEGFDLNL